MVIGLTGGIGCGKSAAAIFFAEAGFQVIDVDQLARQVLASPECVAQLRGRWGDACLLASGQPDRAWIGAKVFASASDLAFLESVTHPEVVRLRARAVADKLHHHLVELTLLFEKNLQVEFDVVVCVTCSESVREARLLARGLTLEQIQQRVKSQLPLAEKVKRSNFVIWNDGTRVGLRAQVSVLLGRLSV